MHYAIFDTAWGAFGFVERNQRLLATFLPRKRKEINQAIRASWPDAIEADDPLPHFRQAIINYFEGERVRFGVEINLCTFPPFYRSALEACRLIRYGQTASYAELAAVVGKPNAARAVGSAMARNPLPLVVPCHRVLSADGSIGGFSSTNGVDEKARLLRLENVAVERHGEKAAVGKTTGPAFGPVQGASRKAGTRCCKVSL